VSDIEIVSLNKSFGSLVIFRDLHLNIKRNKVTAILGPSGCGKTTLLGIIAGIVSIEHGEISGIVNESISYLFQEPRLLPWLTVFDNLKLVIPENHRDNSVAERTEAILSIVGLKEFSYYYPDELSGGMRQRAAMARAFLYPSTILLMDEPFQALDIRLRLSFMKTFNSLWRDDKRTSIFVTHDIQEAIYLGDEIIVFSDRPTKVKKRYTNPVSHSERFFGNETLTKLENDIYRYLLD
jgi:NitT/TauT family transport system ATP-binding protein